MTKVQIRFRLQRPVDNVLLTRIADAHAIYGINLIRMDPSLEFLTVEYDATRLHRAEVGAALCAAGLPVEAAK